MKSGPRFRTNAVDKNDPKMVCGLLPTYANDWANGCDFVGNDLSNAKTLNSQCGPKCQATSGCTHFTWTSFNGGTCWMKSGPASGLTVKTDKTMVCGVVSGPTPPGPGPTPGGRQITVKNNCRQPLWIQSSSVFPIQRLDVGQTYTYGIPSAGWKSGRMWPKTGCDASGNNCASGQAWAPCPPQGCSADANTKIEFHMEPENSGMQSWYDISLVDGYSLPVKINPRGVSSGSCVATNCALDLGRCPTGETNGLGDLRLRDRNGNVVACMSPCKRFTSPVSQGGMGQSETPFIGQMMCCPTPPVSVAQCRAGPVVGTQYVGLVRQTCPTAYSYAYDDTNGLHNCPTATSFDVQFC